MAYNYIYEVCDSSSYYPITTYVTTSIVKLSEVIVGSIDTERMLFIWEDGGNSSLGCFTFECKTVYELMMNLIDSKYLSREFIKDLRQYLNSYIEKEIESEKQLEEEKKREQEEADLKLLKTLADKYGKTIV